MSSTRDKTYVLLAAVVVVVVGLLWWWWSSSGRRRPTPVAVLTNELQFDGQTFATLPFGEHLDSQFDFELVFDLSFPTKPAQQGGFLLRYGYAPSSMHPRAPNVACWVDRDTSHLVVIANQSFGIVQLTFATAVNDGVNRTISVKRQTTNGTWTLTVGGTVAATINTTPAASDAIGAGPLYVGGQPVSQSGAFKIVGSICCIKNIAFNSTKITAFAVYGNAKTKCSAS